MEKIVTQLEIAAAPSEVYRAITTTEGERAWWTTDCEVAGQVGGQAAFRFNRMGGEPGTAEMRFRIDKLEPERTVEWTCTANQHNPDWQDTRVVFTLSRTAAGTRLDFAHTGWRERNKVYDACVGGWNHFMNSLKSYLETGKGDPHVR